MLLRIGLLILYLIVVESSKILIVFPIPGRSHYILADGYVRNLLEAGHEVYHVTPYPSSRPPRANETIVDVSSIKGVFDFEHNVDLKVVIENSRTGENVIKMTLDLFYALSSHLMTHENFVRILSDRSLKFDAVVVEWLFNDVLQTIGVALECPVITSISTEPHAMVLENLDINYYGPAYNIQFMGHSSVPPYTFMGRVNSLYQTIKRVYYQWRQRSSDIALYNQVIGPIAASKGIPLPDYYEALYNTSLLLSNTHSSIAVPQGLPSNVKMIGGYHINSENINLTEDLQYIMDNSRNGVIYFSLGTNLKSKMMPDEMKRGILKVFAELNQTVLWKFEEEMPDLPDNVHIMKWLPQPAILAHPNLELFITHGGLISILEAVNYGVPILGIPVMADQFYNVNRAVSIGISEKLDISFDMEEDLRKGVRKMLSNKSYSKKIKHLSSLFRSRPMPPGKELVYWIEYVINTSGAKHMKPQSHRLTLIERLYIDLILVVIQVSLITYCMFRFIFRRKSMKLKVN